MRMSALLSRNTSRPGLIGIARVDRNIDRLLRRVCPGDIVVLDVLDLDRITADALVEAEIAAVVNASSSVSGRYPNLGPEVLVTNGVTLIDETGPEIFKKVKDGAKVRLYEGGVYAGDRRLIRGTERTDHDIADLMREAKSGLVAHLEAFAGNTIEFIRSESPLLIDGIGIPDVDVDLRRRHVVIVADEPSGPDDLKSLKPFIKEYQPVLVGVGTGADVLRKAGYRPQLIVGDPDQISTEVLKCGAQVVLPADAGAKPFNIECKVLAIDTPELVIDTWLLSIDTMLLSGDRCGEMAFQSSLSWSNGQMLFVGWASCCSAWGTLFINWFAAAVSMASSTATACSRSPPGLVISGASSNGSNASVAVAAVAA